MVDTPIISNLSIAKSAGNLMINPERFGVPTIGMLYHQLNIGQDAHLQSKKSVYLLTRNDKSVNVLVVLVPFPC